jgi:hypothetical protein
VFEAYGKEQILELIKPSQKVITANIDRLEMLSFKERARANLPDALLHNLSKKTT